MPTPEQRQDDIRRIDREIADELIVGAVPPAERHGFTGDVRNTATAAKGPQGYKTQETVTLQREGGEPIEVTLTHEGDVWTAKALDYETDPGSRENVLAAIKELLMPLVRREQLLAQKTAPIPPKGATGNFGTETREQLDGDTTAAKPLPENASTNAVAAREIAPGQNRDPEDPKPQGSLITAEIVAAYLARDLAQVPDDCEPEFDEVTLAASGVSLAVRMPSGQTFVADFVETVRAPG